MPGRKFGKVKLPVDVVTVLMFWLVCWLCAVTSAFGMTAPAPSPTTSANDSTKDALASALDKIAALSSANAALASQVASLTSQLATASKVSEKQPDSSSKILTNCYRIAKSIAISKKGTLSKICLNL